MVFYHSSHLYYVRPLMAWLVIYFYLYYIEMLGSLNFSVWLHFFKPITLYREGKTILILHIAFADGGNQTRAACTASECTIHYSIASRHLSPWYLVDSMEAPSWWCSIMVVFVDRDKSHVNIPMSVVRLQPICVVTSELDWNLQTICKKIIYN